MTSITDEITGGTSTNKLLLGLIFFIGIVASVMIGLSRNGVTGTALTMIGGITSLIAFIILTKIGLFPSWILVLMILIVSVIGAFTYLNKTQSGG